MAGFAGLEAIVLPAERKIKEFSFGKALDASLLEKMHTAGVRAIQNSISEKGLELFKTKSGCGCEVHGDLSPAPSSLFEFWQGKDEDGKILGLFLPEDYVASIEGGSAASKKPTILIRSDTDKWTLVHEFMHYLFHEHRNIRTIPIVREFKASVTAFDKKGKDLVEIFESVEASDQRLLDYAEAQVEVLNKSAPFFTFFALEEAVIEAYLIGQFGETQKTGYTDYSLEGAVNYGNQNLAEYYLFAREFVEGEVYNETKKDFEKVLPSGEELIGRLSDSPKNSDLVRKLKEALAIHKDLMGQVRIMFSKVYKPLLDKSKGNSKRSDLNGIISFIKSPFENLGSSKPCAHSDVWREIKISRGKE